MTGREIFLFGVGGLFGICLLNLVQKVGNYNHGIIYSYEELREMKAECEKDLPRSTECGIVVYYLPQAQQLEEVE